MKAMVLAAGIGSRLRPLTDSSPKALIEIGGVPILEIVLRRLIRGGVDSAVVNLHHFADRIADFLKARNNFGIRIELSREEELLDTGGGLNKAAWFFDDGKPFFLHNADVLTDVDLGAMARFHQDHPALATLAAQARPSARYLLFDREGRLAGWESVRENRRQWAKARGEGAQPLAFNGIHVISPEIFPKLTETGAFSITQAYLRLAGLGERIQAFRSEGYYGTISTAAELAVVRRQAAQAGLPG